MNFQIALIDNEDSFTYNLVHSINKSGFETLVISKNEFTESKQNESLEIVEKCSHIVLSPGPGLPSESNAMKIILDKFHTSKKILGVCLGHQAIGEYFGAKLNQFDNPFHGIKSEAKHYNNSHLFNSVPEHFFVGRYHSWYLSEYDFPECLEITCKTNDNIIMGIQHKTYNIHGIQFHPESYITDFGDKTISNFLT